jgi:hypothetical protein
MACSILRALRAAVMTAAAGAAALAAQSPNIQLQGRVQLQYRYSSGDSTGNYSPAGVSNYFEIRRARFQTNVKFGDNIYIVIQPSFEMGVLRMRDAYVRVGMLRNIAVVAGQEKSPFMRYELTSANNLPSIERGVRILRLSGKEGLDDVLLQNGYVSQDLGAGIELQSNNHRYVLKGVVQGGSRESAVDVNNAKSFFGRVTGTVLMNKDKQPLLQLGASMGSRDRAICNAAASANTGCTTNIAFFADSAKYTTAFGLDAEWGGFRPGFHVIADFATGDNVLFARRINTGRNTGNLRNSADSNIATFTGVNIITAYRVLTKGAETRVIKAIEPAIRLDYTDPNTSASNDQGILITPVLNLYFANSVELRAGIDFYMYKDATGASKSAREIKFSWQADF